MELRIFSDWIQCGALCKSKKSHMKTIQSTQLKIWIHIQITLFTWIESQPIDTPFHHKMACKQVCLQVSVVLYDLLTPSLRVSTSKEMRPRQKQPVGRSLLSERRWPRLSRRRHCEFCWAVMPSTSSLQHATANF